MAVPKSKVSKSRRNKRAANWKIEAVDTVVCPQCHSLIQSHRVCKNCGYYDGKQVIEVKQKAE